MIRRITIDVECPLPDSVKYDLTNYDDGEGSFINITARWHETSDVKVISLTVADLAEVTS